MGPVRITTHSLIRDDAQGDTFYTDVTKSIDGNTTKVQIAAPGGVVSPVEIVDETREVARHELRQYIAMRNMQAKVRSMPEAHRRKEERKQRLRQERAKERCPGCGGFGYIQDEDLNQKPCPSCSG